METCPICREYMDTVKQNYVLVCNHQFHTECIIDSLRTNNECPVCRDTGGHQHFTSDKYYNDPQANTSNKINKKIEDVKNMALLMNDIIESNDDIKNLRKKIKTDLNTLNSISKIIHNKISVFEKQLDIEYNNKLDEYIISMSETDDYSNVLKLKNSYKNNISELYTIIHNTMIQMGIPESAIYSVHFNKYGKLAFEKCNKIYNDGRYDCMFTSIRKRIKKYKNLNYHTDSISSDIN